jgi:hypothetical protein
MRRVTITHNMPEHEAKRKLRWLGRQKKNRNEGFDDLIAELKRYEKKFGMSTLEFYEKFCRGKMDDSSDVLIWAGLYEAYMILVQDLAKPKVAAR